MTSATDFPVRLTGELDQSLSRWLWLVKMFLAIPHYVVLAFLWIAFLVTTVVAGFAILFTGRYPRVPVRLQCRRTPLELAGRVLRVRRPGHRPLPAVHPGPGRLPGRDRRRVPRTPVPRPGAGQVAAGGPAPARRRSDRRRPPAVPVDQHRLVHRPPAHRRLLVPQPARRRRRSLPAGHRYVPARPLRPTDGHQPLVLPGAHLRRPDARRVPAVPPRPGATQEALRQAAISSLRPSLSGPV